jgi:hypothetical protein
MGMDHDRPQFHLRPILSVKIKGEMNIKLFRFKHLGASFNGAKDSASESHAHICSVSCVQTSIKIGMHIIILKIRQKPK